MNPLTWESYDAWARAKGHALADHEVDALFALVSVMQSPGDTD